MSSSASAATVGAPTASAAAGSTAGSAAGSASASAPSSLRGLHILVTGGAGYIGSHTVLALLLADARVTVVDNLSNSSRESLARVKQLAGGGRSAEFVRADIRDEEAMAAAFKGNKFDACIHFAGLKVGRREGRGGSARTAGECSGNRRGSSAQTDSSGE